MALTPTLSYEERNDNLVLTVADTSNLGVDGNPEASALTVIDLDIVYTDSSGTETTYDTIDLHALHGHATQADMTYDITCAMLKVSGTAIGTATDEIPDGLYEMTYTLNTTEGTPETILLDGVVRVAVYDLLREIPTIYNCDECKSKTVLDAIYCYGCLNVLRSNAYAAKNEELISLLYTLERLVEDGSRYTW